MITARTASVLLCAVLTASMQSPRGSGGYNAGAQISLAPQRDEPMSPSGAISPEQLQLLTDAAKQAPAFTAYGGELEDCTLKSQEGTEIIMSREFAKQATLLKNMLEDNDDEHIPLPNVKAPILQKVVDYMNYHGENPEVSIEIQKPLKSTNLLECGVAEWDASFVDEANLPQEQLFEVILAANYMDIKGLLDLSCAKVASMIKGKNTEDIRKQFNIEGDLTAEEKAQVEEENKWCDDQ